MTLTRKSGVIIMERVIQPLIIVGAFIVEGAFATAAPLLWFELGSGDPAAAVVLVLGAFILLYLVRAQLACMLGVLAAGAARLGAPGAHRLAGVSRMVCPKLLRATLATSLAAGLGFLGTDAASAAPVPSGSSSAAATAPGWPDSSPSPGWPDSHSGSPTTPTRARTPVPSSAATASPSHRATASTRSPGWPAQTRPPQRRRESHRRADRSQAAAGDRHRTVGATVVVRSGDTLWGIAAHHLRKRGAPADSAAVGAYVRRIHRANARVIGANPDLIIPGQRLDLP